MRNRLVRDRLLRTGLVRNRLVAKRFVAGSLAAKRLGRGFRGSFGTALRSRDLRTSILRTRRFRGGSCSLVWHCASFVFLGLCSRRLGTGVPYRRPGAALGCAAAYRSGFLRNL